MLHPAPVVSMQLACVLGVCGHWCGCSSRLHLRSTTVMTIRSSSSAAADCPINARSAQCTLLPPSPHPVPPGPLPQELVALLGRNQGVVLMAPPSNSPEAQVALSTMSSAIKGKSKVRATQHELHTACAASLLMHIHCSTASVSCMSTAQLALLRHHCSHMPRASPSVLQAACERTALVPCCRPVSNLTSPLPCPPAGGGG
jgi:hypothetical protein